MLAFAAVVFVDLDVFTVNQMPVDVHVTTRRRLVGWLGSVPSSLDGQAQHYLAITARSGPKLRSIGSRSGNNLRLTQVLDFDPTRVAEPSA